MSYPKYQRMKDDVPISPDPPPMKDDVPISPGPPPYSEIEPDVQKNPTESTHCGEWEESLITPPIYSPGRTASKEIPVLQQAKTVIIVPVERNKETYYAPSSLLCCLIPLGSIAFCFFKRAQKARLRGDTVAAQRNERIATTLVRISFAAWFLLFVFLVLFKLSYR